MCNHHNDNQKEEKRLGSALEHGQAHEQDHRRWSRRTFMRNLGIAGSASFLLGKIPVTALAASPLGFALSNSNSDRILVLIRLKGGNDGLNMIIPVYDYGTYQSYRPTIRVPQDQITDLGGGIGIPSYMDGMHSLWQDGKMKVVHDVGYPDQSLSHFRSSDIWASGSDAGQQLASGWLGRFLENEFPDYLVNPPEEPPAIQIGGAGNLVFTNSDLFNMSVIVNNPQELAQIAQNGQLYDPTDVPDCYYGEQLTFMRSVANSTFKYAGVINQAYSAATNAVDYQFNLGAQLALVARLIKGGLGTQLYMVELDGFDTHALQTQTHPFLLFQLSQAVKAFYDDLAEGGVAHRVLCMTHSEFGRRIEQNASGGTDHGAASPLLVFGNGVNGNGFVGTQPNLQNLDNTGNLIYSVDFRRIYATVLEYWLCIESADVDGVLGQSFERLPQLGLDCAPTSTRQAQPPAIDHRLAYGDGEVIIMYDLPEAANVTVQVFDMIGRPVETLFSGYQLAGEHSVAFRDRQARLAAGIYVYSIKVGRQAYSGKIRMVR